MLVVGQVVGSATTASATPVEEAFSIALASETFGDALFTRADSTIAFTQVNQGTQEMVSVSVWQDDLPVLELTFSSRDDSGQRLAVGYYDHAQRYPFTDPGRPGISASPIGFCTTQSGNFEVRDIQREGARIDRLWLTFQRLCNGVDPVFGELRLGYPESDLEVSPRVVRWPAGTYPNRAGHDVPVVVKTAGTSPVEVSSVTLAGPHASDFVVRHDGCTGADATAGCLVEVGFTPHSPGPRHAELLVATAAGATAVSLDGSSALGTSDWALVYDPDAPSLPNQTHTMSWSASRGGPYEFQTQAVGAGGTLWEARFDLGGTESFRAGHFEYTADRTGLLLSLTRGNEDCEVDRASVDIAEIAFSGPDSELDMFDLTMSAHCRGFGATVQGRLRFHDRPDLTAPAPVTGLTATRVADTVGLTWTEPSEPDVAGAIVRWYNGSVAPSAPDGGQSAMVDVPASAVIPAVTGPVSAAVWTYDTSGNLGARTEITIP
jgi:hypothetical protein